MIRIFCDSNFHKNTWIIVYLPSLRTSRARSCFVHFKVRWKWQTTSAITTKVRWKWQTTSATMAWLFLPENEQVQYLQKIASRKMPSGPKKFNPKRSISCSTTTRRIFRMQCDFLLTIEVSTFSGQVSAIEARDEAIFTRTQNKCHTDSTENTDIMFFGQTANPFNHEQFVANSWLFVFKKNCK